VRPSGPLSAQRLAGEVEVDVLEGARLDPQVVGVDAVRGAPGGDGGQQLRVDRALDQVLPGRGLLGQAPSGSADSSWSRSRPGGGPEAQLPGCAVPGELVDGAGGDDAAGVEHHDVVGEPLGLVHEVGGEHDGDAVGAQRLDQLPGAPARLRVEPGRRLVEEDQLGAPDDGHRQRQPLLLAAGQPPDRACARRRPGRAARAAARVERACAEKEATRRSASPQRRPG
jgi:hypothetical protein